MTKLDQLEKDVLKAQEHINRLLDKRDKSTAAVIADPDDDKAAIAATAAEMQVKAAEKAKEQAKEAVQAEKDRLYHEELDAVGKQLKQMEGQAQALTDAIYNDVLETLQKVKAWERIVKDHERLAREYNLAVPDLFNRERTRGHTIELKEQLEGWQVNRDYYFKNQASVGG